MSRCLGPCCAPQLEPGYEEWRGAIQSILLTYPMAVMTKVSRAQCPILSRNSTILMQQMLTRHSMALRRKNSRRRTGSPMTQFYTTSQLSKRRCIPSVSSVNEIEVHVAKSNFHLIMRHFSRPNYDGQAAGWLNVGDVLMFRCESLL